MKAEELMIGDWVKQHNCTTPSQVATVSETKIYTYWADGSKHAKDQYYFDPIPLTPEILEKNGFKDYTEIREYQFEEDGEKHRFYLKKMYNKENKCDAWGTNIGGVLPSVIMYVHELQNALRLCGLNELADNFKV